MSISKQRQLQDLLLEKEQKEADYKTALKSLIHSEQTLRISLDFSQEYLKNNSEQTSLEQFLPIHISRLIFDKELQAIKKQMAKMPEDRCRIEHFIIIMLKVMKFPFQKIPLYMVGLKDMFYEIAEEGKDSIGYDEILKYVLGELVTLQEQQQNTQFQVHFQQRKKQDYLLHDNGLKRVFYSNDLKMVMSLDERESAIKLYNEDMKNISRFTTRKDLHQGRIPTIVDFDYSELTMRMAVIFADATIESIHLHNFIEKTTFEFQSSTLNQLLFTMPEPMRRVYYIQMLNKWLTVSEDDDRVYLFDMEKVRLKPQEVMQRVSIDNNDLKISLVLQIVPLSTICFVAGNQITFYNENLTDKKFAKFSHHEIINILKYCEQKNAFYLAGKQKSITIFTINRNQTSFRIWTMQVNRIIVDLEIFPYFDTLLVCDESHEVRLIHEPTKTVYQQYPLAHIVKMKDKYLRSYKISKTEFMVYQTYMLIFSLQKIAIEKEMEFNFIPNYYYDHKKEEVYFSVNNQIISFSVLFGDIRKNYSFDTSNIAKHQGFYLGSKTHLFIFDSHKNIYEVYMKNEDVEGQNRNYRRTVAIGEVIAHFYDEEMRNFMVVGNNCVHQIRNDSDNNFNTINIIYLVNFPKIAQAIFCPRTKYLTFITSNQLIYQFRNFQTHFSKCFKFSFPKSNNDLEDKLFIQVEYCSEFQILILLNNKNQIIIVERLNIANHIIINVNQYLPFKLKSIIFNRFTYHLFKEKTGYQPSVLLYADTGYIFDIDLQKLFSSKFGSTLKEEKFFKSFIKESYEMNPDSVSTEAIDLKPKNTVKLNTTDFIMQKAHEKPIAIGIKLKIQLIRTLTIGKDGFMKLWNKSYTCLFVLKIPSFLKITWNMEQILKIKNKKSVNQVLQIITNHYTTKDYLAKPLQIVNKTKRQRQHIEPTTKKIKPQPAITIQIESKEIQDIVTHEEDYLKNYQITRASRQRIKDSPEATTMDSHPWRTKRQFLRIFQRASPTNRYSHKIPKDLITLRTSLDMTERKKKAPNLKLAELVLPQLKSYENEVFTPAEQQAKQQKDEFQNFESCLYVKTERRKKRANELDEIDRQFFRKAIAMQNRRWIPKYGKEKKNSTIDVSESIHSFIEENRYDTMKQIRTIFEQHNRQCSETKKGRLINIPKIKLIREYES